MAVVADGDAPVADPMIGTGGAVAQHGMDDAGHLAGHGDDDALVSAPALHRLVPSLEPAAPVPDRRMSIPDENCAQDRVPPPQASAAAHAGTLVVPGADPCPRSSATGSSNLSTPPWIAWRNTGATVRRISAGIGTNASMGQFHFSGKANLMRAS